MSVIGWMFWGCVGAAVLYFMFRRSWKAEEPPEPGPSTFAGYPPPGEYPDPPPVPAVEPSAKPILHRVKAAIKKVAVKKPAFRKRV